MPDPTPLRLATPDEAPPARPTHPLDVQTGEQGLERCTLVHLVEMLIGESDYGDPPLAERALESIAEDLRNLTSFANEIENGDQSVTPGAMAAALIRLAERAEATRELSRRQRAADAKGTATQ